MGATPNLQPLWIPLHDGDQEKPDTHVAFRGTFALDEPTEVQFRLVGASWFTAWIDGKLLAEGPLRFPRTHPQWDVALVALPAGRHVIALQAQYYGVDTGLMLNMPPFVACDATGSDEPIEIAWKCRRLEAYASQVRRTSPIFGWAEFCDTRTVPLGWLLTECDDSGWEAAAPCDPGIGEPTAPQIGPVQRFVMPLEPVAQGRFSEEFGYENCDPPVRFFLRDLEPRIHEPQGVWRRYDLGLTRLGRPRFELDLPEGAVVEFGYSEILRQGRVSPWMTLAGFTCYMDRYIARGGVQEFMPMAPKGQRYLEVHVNADPSKIEFLREEFIERCYHATPEGSFQTDDDLLNRIWTAGMDTYRACAEDAVLDCPTRERGQWIGDMVGAGMEIASVGYSDLRLIKRALVQATQCAREDGMVAGLCPQKPGYLSTYAAQWTGAVLHHWQLTGDRSLVDELYPAAERNMAAFELCLSEQGVGDCDAWAFVDWGYVRNEGPTDMALNLHVLEAARCMESWSRVTGRDERAAHYAELAKRLTGIVRNWLDATISNGWDAVGFQRAALGLRLGLFAGSEVPGNLAFMKRHMVGCFPNDPTAPRPFDPSMTSTRLITPYFSHYSMPPLIENGEMDFVLDQFRTCWGYALSLGITTSLEVFDTRWSQCHQWAACPTWQLSRYVLGLHPRFDLGEGHFDFKLIPGSLQRASGKVPLPGGPDPIKVSWERDGVGIVYRVVAPTGASLHFGGRLLPVSGTTTLSLSLPGSRWEPI